MTIVNLFCYIFFENLSQIWPEKTNPEKYVFEDVAIATYLLVSRVPVFRHVRICSTTHQENRIIKICK